MLEEYLDTITNMENYADGIIVIDDQAKVIYIRQFKPDLSPLDERRAIGKSIFEIYPTLKPETSTLIAAIQRGETTLNNRETLTTSTGESFQIIDNTFPIKQDDSIIGAVSVATFPDKDFSLSGINLHSDTVPQVKDLYTIEDIIGRSKQTQDLRIQICRVSATSSSVLIYGSTGTGKEMVAQSIHSASERKNKKFISQKTVLPFRQLCWKAFSSELSRAPIQEPKTKPVSLKALTAVPSSSMRSIPWISTCRQNCCAC